jgi:hypothetical protein
MREDNTSEGAEKSMRLSRISLEAITWNSATELSPFGIKVFCVTGGNIPVLTVMPASLITRESRATLLLTFVLTIAVFFLHAAENNSRKHKNAIAGFVVDGGGFILAQNTNFLPAHSGAKSGVFDSKNERPKYFNSI